MTFQLSEITPMSSTLFFVVSKLVWFLIRPETIVLLFFGAGLLALHKHRIRLARWLLGIPFVFLVMLSVFPLGDFVLRPLELSYARNPETPGIDGIIVLGGAEDIGLSALWEQPVTNQAGERFLTAIALAHRHPNAKLLFSGGSGKLRGSGSPKINVARSIFLSAGIAPDRLVTENLSRNTAENARFSRDLLGSQETGTWVLVTSAFHMRRAVASFCTAGWQNLIPWPTDYRSGELIDRIGWNLASNLENLNTGAKEWLGIHVYRFTGRSVSTYMKGCPRPL